MRRLPLVAALATAACLFATASASASGDLRSEWYFDAGLQRLAHVDGDEQIDFEWDAGTGPPHVGDKFSARWTGQISPRYSEQYTFVIKRDDVARLWVGGQLLFDEDWSVGHTGSVTSNPIVLQANNKYDLKLEFADRGGDAEIRLGWKSPSQPKQTVPASRLFAPAPPSSQDPPGVELNGPGPILPAAPQPDAGRTVAGSTESGKIRVRKPGRKRSAPLNGSDPVQVGSVIDARHGQIELIAEGARDKHQTVQARGAVFTLAQKRRGDRVVTLALKPLRGCRGRARSSARKRNRLWAHAHGRFRTRGHGSAATVRGTTWSVTDTCGSTVTTVREGLVAVRDFARRRTVLVPAGKRYVARWLSARR